MDRRGTTLRTYDGRGGTADVFVPFDRSAAVSVRPDAGSVGDVPDGIGRAARAVVETPGGVSARSDGWIVGRS